MPTWTEEQLVIINALQDQIENAEQSAKEAKTTAAAANAEAEEGKARASKAIAATQGNSALDDARYQEILTIAKQDRDDNAEARTQLNDSNEKMYKSLLDKVNDLEVELDEAKVIAEDAKAKAEQALYASKEYEANSVERYAQTQKLIANLNSLIDDNKDCCESNMKNIDNLGQAIKLLQKFVVSINDHTHSDDLLAGEKMLTRFKLERTSGIDTDNFKKRRKFNRAAFYYESDGKLGSLMQAIEDWITPFLHQHEIGEAVEEAAQEYVAEEAVLAASVAAKSQLES